MKDIEPEANVWPPPPTNGAVQTIAMAFPKRVYRTGVASLIISVLAFLIGVVAVSLVPTSLGKRLPYGFLGNCDMLVFGLLIVGIFCGIYGRRSAPGKIGLSLSIGSLCIMIALLIVDLANNHVI